MKAVRIPAVDSPVVIEDVDITLDYLNKAVGGYIEPVGLPGLLAMAYVNEEGRLHKLPLNQRASTLAQQPIVGDVVIVGLPDRKGNDTACPESVINAMRTNGWME